MRSLKSIKYKAAFLLTVFTLNTIISFACSVGMDMGFNSSHHADETKSKDHSHGGKHEHSHSHGTAHKHPAPSASVNDKNSDQKDNCCNKKAVELQKLDKSSNHSSTPVMKVPVFISLLTALAGVEIKAELSPVLNKAFIPQYYPPPDKRIIIQSFQI